MPAVVVPAVVVPAVVVPTVGVVEEVGGCVVTLAVGDVCVEEGAVVFDVALADDSEFEEGNVPTVTLVVVLEDADVFSELTVFAGWLITAAVSVISVEFVVISEDSSAWLEEREEAQPERRIAIIDPTTTSSNRDLNNLLFIQTHSCSCFFGHSIFLQSGCLYDCKKDLLNIQLCCYLSAQVRIYILFPAGTSPASWKIGDGVWGRGKQALANFIEYH